MDIKELEQLEEDYKQGAVDEQELIRQMEELGIDSIEIDGDLYTIETSFAEGEEVPAEFTDYLNDFLQEATLKEVPLDESDRED